jgi:Zn-finger nucleic acid-binding protein
MLECPKCAAEMVTTDRSGIMIDECSGCRGVYLDRGELELLIDAESQYLATLPAAENPDTTYQGRHRHGVVRQVFGEPDGNSQAGTGNGEAVRPG